VQAYIFLNNKICHHTQNQMNVASSKAFCKIQNHKNNNERSENFLWVILPQQLSSVESLELRNHLLESKDSSECLNVPERE
jgi:hypothetical protein